MPLFLEYNVTVLAGLYLKRLALAKNIFVRRRSQKFLGPARATSRARLVPALAFKSLTTATKTKPADDMHPPVLFICAR